MVRSRHYRDFRTGHEFAVRASEMSEANAQNWLCNGRNYSSFGGRDADHEIASFPMIRAGPEKRELDLRRHGEICRR